MNFTITRYRLDDDIARGNRFVHKRGLWFVRIGRYGHSLRIWRQP